MYIHQMFGFFIMVTNFHKKCGLGLGNTINFLRAFRILEGVQARS